MQEGVVVRIEDPRRLRRVLAALKNERRLKILAMLAERPLHIYGIAKRLGISYQLAYMYIAALERAGLVEGEYKTVERSRRQRKYFRVVEFEISLTPEEDKGDSGEGRERLGHTSSCRGWEESPWG